MNATDSDGSAPATFLATVDLPLPDPPAIPMMRGFKETDLMDFDGLGDLEPGEKYCVNEGPVSNRF